MASIGSKHRRKHSVNSYFYLSKVNALQTPVAEQTTNIVRNAADVITLAAETLNRINTLPLAVYIVAKD